MLKKVLKINRNYIFRKLNLIKFICFRKYFIFIELNIFIEITKNYLDLKKNHKFNEKIS